MHLFKEKINFKQPSGGGFEPHLDAPAFAHLGKLSTSLSLKEVTDDKNNDKNESEAGKEGKTRTGPLTVLFVVEDMTTSNGCLELVPGSQKENIPLGMDNCIEKSWVEGKGWVPVELKAGKSFIACVWEERGEEERNEKRRIS